MFRGWTRDYHRCDVAPFGNAVFDRRIEKIKEKPISLFNLLLKLTVILMNLELIFMFKTNYTFKLCL
jgi:hypothetical protein